MTDRDNELAQNYICPKCHGRKADVREITISKSRLLDLLPSRDNRYVEVTCVLCGYTEFYNRALYVASQVRAVEAGKNLAVPKKANGG